MFTGISFSQKSAKFALAKLYATLLQTAQSMRKDGTSNEDMDSYWTLVGYYNSIRELGGSNRLVEDDVKKDMKYLAQTIHKDKVPVRDPGTPGNGIDELTGRKTQLEINQIRTKLEKTLPNTDVISVLLATNMIATGIDINRLALMIINGQPKTVTEYIQASGRIGRNKKSPGSVFVFLNPYKPRDLSHYQNFTGFHNHMQKMVEPSGLTPFSIPAYNRGLHSVLIAMIRLSNPRLAQNTSAHRFEIDDAEDASKFILERFMTVEEVDSSSESYIQFEKKLNTIKDRWALYIEKAKSFDSIPEKKSTGLKIQNINEVWYYNKYDKYHPEPKNNNVLMIEFAKSTQQDSENFPLSTPESLRDVEQQIVMEYV
jgi:superfamily II DNA/RNA helicase